MKKNTGLTLSETQGPLKKLLENLSGKHGAYWLEVLTKILRKEDPPKPPAEVLKLLNQSIHRENAKEKVEKLVAYLNTISVVQKATMCSADEEGDLINIEIFPNLASFIHGENNGDGALFSLRIDHCVQAMLPAGEQTDAVFQTWKKLEYPNLRLFCEALLELEKLYKKCVPNVPLG